MDDSSATYYGSGLRPSVRVEVLRRFILGTFYMSNITFPMYMMCH